MRACLNVAFSPRFLGEAELAASLGAGEQAGAARCVHALLLLLQFALVRRHDGLLLAAALLTHVGGALLRQTVGRGCRRQHRVIRRVQGGRRK
jgi:hypothetical protein